VFDFLFKKSAIRSTQRYIDKIKPSLNINLHDGVPIPSAKYIKKNAMAVSEINKMEEAVSQLSNEELSEKTVEFKKRYNEVVKESSDNWDEVIKKSKEEAEFVDLDEQTNKLETAEKNFKKARKDTLNAMLPEVFAVGREVGKRILNMRHFDVQLIGGMVLHDGNIAEMTTGEGKTLVATLPGYLNALTGEGVHVVTVNDYLAKRDSEWMGPFYEFLGLSVGVILHLALFAFVHTI